MTSNLRGISCAIIAGLFLTGNDAVSKWLVPVYPPGQILFVSSLGLAVVIWIFSQRKVSSRIVVNSWRTHISRGVLFAVSAFAFITSLEYLPLADTMCIAFAAPILVTFLGRFVLKEYVGIYRLSAVLLGFIGVIVMIQPASDSFRWILLLPLVVAIADACRDVLTRKMTQSESSLSMVFTTSLTIAAIALPTYFLGWSIISLGNLWIFILKIGLMLFAYFLLIEAYRFAPTVVISPFRYIQLVWGILLGFIIWQEIPELHVFIGVFITVGSGLFIALREAKLTSERV